MLKKNHNPNAIKSTKGDRILDIVIIILLVLITIAVAYPLYLVAIASISDPQYISTGQVILLPKGLNLEAYRILFDTRDIWIGYRNSLFYTVVGTFLQMLVTTAAAYGLSKKGIPGRNFFSLLFVFTMYFNGGMIPTYLTLKDYGMINTVWALLIPTIFGPYNYIICRNYFESSIPGEVYESASLDGSSEFRTFAQIAVPLAKPVLAVMTLNFALGHWNTYMESMLYISNDEIQSLQVFIKRITTAASASLDSGAGVIKVEDIIKQVRQTQLLKYAVVMVSSIPMIMLYPFISKHFVKGIMLGSVKG